MGEVWGSDVESEVAGGVGEDYSDGKEAIPNAKDKISVENSGLSEGTFDIVENNVLENSEKDKNFENFDKYFLDLAESDKDDNFKSVNNKVIAFSNKVVNSVGMALNFGDDRCENNKKNSEKE